MLKSKSCIWFLFLLTVLVPAIKCKSTHLCMRSVPNVLQRMTGPYSLTTAFPFGLPASLKQRGMRVGTWIRETCSVRESGDIPRTKCGWRSRTCGHNRVYNAPKSLRCLSSCCGYIDNRVTMSDIASTLCRKECVWRNGVMLLSLSLFRTWYRS